MGGNTGARWGGLMVLALLLLGWHMAAAPARADQPAKELTEEERTKLDKEATELNDQAVQLCDDGKYETALELAKKSLDLRKRLYPADQYREGHPDLSLSLSNVGFLLGTQGQYDKAEPFLRDALDMNKRLYPAEKYPDGQPDLAHSLNNLGALLQARGEYAKAEPYCREALEMYRKLYPRGKYPGGHPDLVMSLNTLGLLLTKWGEYGKAEPYYREALDMTKRLYPTEQYPDGHPDVAMSLSNLGTLLEDRGDYGKAEPFYRKALEMRKRLYPPGKYPDGHPDLAISLDSVGTLLKNRGEYAKAEPSLRDALEMRKRLYPAEQYPEGHPDLALSLNNVAAVLEYQGEYGKAEPYYREALQIYRRLYPVEKYPDGHPDLAASISNLGSLLDNRGEHGQAEPYYREAVEIYRRLYPRDKYPDGQSDLAHSLNNLGSLILERGEYGKAEPLYREALEMRRNLYPPDKYPGGQRDLAMSINNLAALLDHRGEYGKAEPLYREALAMHERLYPPDEYPDGHPALALNLNNLASMLYDQGQYGKAEPFLREAMDLYRLYPAEKYPEGQPDLAMSLYNLGYLRYAQGQYGKAAQTLGEGLAMYDRMTAAFADAAAEAEVLNLSASLPSSRNDYLAAAAHADDVNPTDQYPLLWRGKSTLAHVQQQRRRLLRAAAASDKDVRARLQELIAVRQDLARLILAPAATGAADRTQLLKELTDRKERLESDLARVLPPSARQSPPYTDLAGRLPDHAAFIDLYRYIDLDKTTRKGDTGHYAAFLLQQGRPIRRIELDGAAVSIEKDLRQWREDIDKGLRSDAAGRLRVSVWEPIAKGMGDDIQTVYLCPDAELSALPWAALPGASAGRVLMEDYTIAVVPSGPFLLEQLTREADPNRDAGVLLTVGGVRYDRGAPAGKPWRDLPATVREREAVTVEAGKLAKPPAVVERSGDDANVSHLVKDLPTARWAHLATHGFFAAPDSTEREHLFRPDDFLMGVGGERRGAAARNPLTLSGLVLAGANQPTDRDGGVLTGEAVAGLDLDGMDLAVLSACQTGLGEAADGEGVFGLQRAFHIAGCKNVIASLWKVDDDATAALMNLFYIHLWEKGEPPLEALHQAQLALYRNPASIPKLAQGHRDGDFEETVRLVTKPPADPKAPATRPAAVKDWAAFALSGAGRYRGCFALTEAG